MVFNNPCVHGFDQFTSMLSISKQIFVLICCIIYKKTTEESMENNSISRYIKLIFEHESAKITQIETQCNNNTSMWAYRHKNKVKGTERINLFQFVSYAFVTCRHIKGNVYVMIIKCKQLRKHKVHTCPVLRTCYRETVLRSQHGSKSMEHQAIPKNVMERLPDFTW